MAAHKLLATTYEAADRLVSNVTWLIANAAELCPTHGAHFRIGMSDIPAEPDKVIAVFFTISSNDQCTLWHVEIVDR